MPYSSVGPRCELRQGFPQICRPRKGPSEAAFSAVWHANCPIIQHVLILALDTSSPSGSLAVLRDDNLIGAVATSTSEIYSSRVFRHLEFLLAELSLRLEDFDLFAVAAGPGSFTGLRVGLTAVKGWAEVYRKPIAAISALEAVAAQSRQRVSTLVPVLDARRGELYFGVYRRQDSADHEGLVLEDSEHVATRDELASALLALSGDDGIAVVTPAPAMLSAGFSPSEKHPAIPSRVLIDRVSGFLAPEIGHLGYLRAREGKLADSLTLDANYVRRSDAELHWKGSAGS
jgi:tRNA threonylcarbamoyladenosine biosynthesis protein TsaB